MSYLRDEVTAIALCHLTCRISRIGHPTLIQLVVGEIYILSITIFKNNLLILFFKRPSRSSDKVFDSNSR